LPFSGRSTRSSKALLDFPSRPGLLPGGAARRAPGENATDQSITQNPRSASLRPAAEPGGGTRVGPAGGSGGRAGPLSAPGMRGCALWLGASGRGASGRGASGRGASRCAPTAVWGRSPGGVAEGGQGVGRRRRAGPSSTGGSPQWYWGLVPGGPGGGRAVSRRRRSTPTRVGKTLCVTSDRRG
jgi:ATP-dependent RNA helicase DeaD